MRKLLPSLLCLAMSSSAIAGPKTKKIMIGSTEYSITQYKERTVTLETSMSGTRHRYFIDEGNDLTPDRVIYIVPFRPIPPNMITVKPSSKDLKTYTEVVEKSLEDQV